MFFVVGFITCLNDIIIPHLKSIFELSYGQAMLVQFAFFSSYFVFSYPAGKLVDRVGYTWTMVGGLWDSCQQQVSPTSLYFYSL
jgi:FHS family L-fucose permease-like MFS transporter